MTPVARLYEKFLIDNDHISQEWVDNKKAEIKEHLEDAYKASKTLTYEAEDWQVAEWSNIKQYDQGTAHKTGIEVPELKDVGVSISRLPEEKNFHRLVKKIFDQRVQTIETGEGIDWGTAESLAFATLIKDGYKVRISGQDVERGTFSHRHAHVFFQDTDGYYNPINETFKDPNARNFIASNSHLSEFAVMGYELGYAQTHPNCLTLWEAQFGDFANGAQVIIDQFVCSGESKWGM